MILLVLLVLSCYAMLFYYNIIIIIIIRILCILWLLALLAVRFEAGPVASRYCKVTNAGKAKAMAHHCKANNNRCQWVVIILLL